MAKGAILEEFRLCTLLSESTTGASQESKSISVRSEAVLLSLYVEEVTGTLDVNVYTWTKENPYEEKLIDSFPQITAPTGELVIRKQIEVMDHIRVEVITSDAAKYNVKAKGVRAGISSVSIQGAGSWQVTNDTVTSTPTLIISGGLAGRTGLLVKNANYNTGDILQVAESEAKLLAGIYYSVAPGAEVQPDVDAGNEVWMQSDGNPIRIEIIEVGD